MKTAEKNALDIQVAGTHYKEMRIQPVEFIHANNIGFCEATAIKYLCRWRKKGGIEDLKKAKHFIDVLIELETRDLKAPNLIDVTVEKGFEVKDGPYCCLCATNLADYRLEPENHDCGLFPLYYCSNCCAEHNIPTGEMTLMGTL